MKHGRNAPFKKVANGVPGLEVRTALLFSEAVGKGRIDLPTFVAASPRDPSQLMPSRRGNRAGRTMLLRGCYLYAVCARRLRALVIQVIELARYFTYARFEITPLSGAIYEYTLGTLSVRVAQNRNCCGSRDRCRARRVEPPYDRNVRCRYRDECRQIDAPLADGFRKQKCGIEDLAGDWRRLDERIEGLSSEIEALARMPSRRGNRAGRTMLLRGVLPICSLCSQASCFCYTSY